MVVVRFGRYEANKRDLEVKTRIKMIAKRGHEVEIEFDGNPSDAELLEIARRLGLYKIEVLAGKKERRLIRELPPKPKRVVIMKSRRAVS